MAITPAQLRNITATQNERVTRKPCRYQDAKRFIEAIASSGQMPTLFGLREAGYMGPPRVQDVYYQYLALTFDSKWRRANIDRVYKMIHG
jgi:hypothetical protein